MNEAIIQQLVDDALMSSNNQKLMDAQSIMDYKPQFNADMSAQTFFGSNPTSTQKAISNAVLNKPQELSETQQAIADYQPTQSQIQNKLVNAASQAKNGISDFITGYQDNYNNNFANGNFNSTEPTSMAQRLGEFAGSAGRILQNPVVQGLVAAAITKQVNPGGGWRNAANIGLDIAQKRGASEQNRAILQSMGYQVPNTGVFGNVSDNAMKVPVSDYYNRGRVTNQEKQIGINQQKADQTYEINKEKVDAYLHNVDERTRVALKNIEAKMSLGVATIQERQAYHSIMAEIGKQNLDYKRQNSANIQSNSDRNYQLKQQQFEYQKQRDAQKDEQKGLADGTLIQVSNGNETFTINASLAKQYAKKGYKRI